MRSRRALVSVLALVALAGSLGPASGVGAGPHLRVLAASDHVHANRFGQRAFVDLGVYLAVTEAPFEIRVERSTYKDPFTARQVLQGGATREVPMELVQDLWGFEHFATVRIARDGEPIRRIELDWCPAFFERQRLGDEGPLDPTYPWVCRAHPFTLGTVWGIDQGWAAQLSSQFSVKLGDGDYTATLRLRDAFSELFEIAPEDAEATVQLTVGPFECEGCAAEEAGRDGRPAPEERVLAAAVPEDPTPDPATVPDLIPLPAYGVSLHDGDDRDMLRFSANVWNAGPGALVVEGFRQEGTDVMDAYQYFWQDGEPVARAPVGGFEFDRHDGHHHWHFLQFARYRLLSEDKQVVVRSKKQAFCLAPTDAIDLLLPTAEWQPGLLGFSQCGDPTSLWIRETLPVGWGDTYIQSLPGQAFDVTDVPNGTYYIEVTANPQGLLHEADATNDRRLRKVIIRGEPGARRASVPAWNGIDTG